MVNLDNLSRVMLMVTQECQFQCLYCFEKHQNKNNINLQTTIDVINILSKNKEKNKQPASLIFFGGEPLLRFDDIIKPAILYIREKLNDKMFNLSITTNGILLTEEIIDFFTKYNVSIMLSLDGNKESQNITRHFKDDFLKDSYEPVIKNINYLLNKRPLTNFRITLTPQNVHTLFDSLKTFSDFGIENVKVFPDLMFSKWKNSDFEILEKELNKYNNYLYENFMSDNLPIVIESYKTMFHKILLNQYELKTSKYRESAYCKKCNRCGIGFINECVCDYQGNLYTCDRVELISDENNIFYIGDIYNGINEEKILKLLELNSNNFYNDNINCKNCYLDNVCTGGCSPVNYYLTGDFNNPPDNYCKYYQIIYKKTLELLLKFEIEKQCELFKDYFYGIVKQVMSNVE